MGVLDTTKAVKLLELRYHKHNVTGKDVEKIE